MLWLLPPYEIICTGMSFNAFAAWLSKPTLSRERSPTIQMIHIFSLTVTVPYFIRSATMSFKYDLLSIVTDTPTSEVLTLSLIHISSVLVETEQTRILLDCGPDFRQQILPLDFRRIDAVLLTHEHYDHVGGIDDLRPFGVFGDVQLYASERTGGQLRQSLPYCFVEHKYPGVPQLRLHAVRPQDVYKRQDLHYVYFAFMFWITVYI